VAARPPRGEARNMSITSSHAARTAAVAAVLFGVAYFLTVASVDVPHDVGDAELLAWWRDDANVTSGVLSLVFAVCTAVLFAVLTNHVLLRVGDRSPHWTAFARSMSSVFTSTLLVSAALRGVVGHLVQVQDEPLPGVDVLRYSTALNYTLMGMVVPVTFALTAISISVAVLRTGALARWVAYVGVGVGAVVLAASAATFGGYTVPIAILWGWCSAVAIWRAPRPSGAVVGVPGTMAA
jgi:hypothetical protein